MVSSIIIGTSPTPLTASTSIFSFGWFDESYNFGNVVYAIQYSTDNVNWTTMATTTGHAVASVNLLQFNVTTALSAGSYIFKVFSIADGYDKEYTSPPLVVTCFVKGTQILCSVNNQDEYIKIENLQKDTLVKTNLNGYKRITNIGQMTFKNKDKCNGIYKLNAGKYGAFEDLLITGAHSILVDSMSESEINEDFMARQIDNTFENKLLSLAMFNKDFEKVQDDNYYTVYHLVLENEEDDNHYGIFANGVLSESMSKSCFEKSQMFENMSINNVDIKYISGEFIVA